MIFSDFIVELRQKEIEISFSAGKLKYSGPEEHITPELIEKLKKYKGKLIKYFWHKEFTNFMPIQPEGNKTPLFLVHGDVGNYSISEYLGQDQPVYGFFHPGSEGEEIRFNNVKEMAKAYIDKLLTLCPTGPYYLTGFSFGGILAFEMAVQLQNSGHKVPFLAMIDCYCPLAKEPIKWQRNFFKILKGNILSPLKRKVIKYMTDCIYRYFFLLKKPIPAERRKSYIWDKYATLTKKYCPVKFNGTVLLFKTKENTSSYKYLGWETLVDNIELFYVEGKHTEIFWNRKSVETIASEIEKQLNFLNVLN